MIGSRQTKVRVEIGVLRYIGLRVNLRALGLFDFHLEVRSKASEWILQRKEWVKELLHHDNSWESTV